jgi:hypothetical protein
MAQDCRFGRKSRGHETRIAVASSCRRNHWRVGSFPSWPLPVPLRLPATCLLLHPPVSRFSLFQYTSQLTSIVHRKLFTPSPAILLILFYLYTCLSFFIFSQPALDILVQPLPVSSCRACCSCRSVEHSLGKLPSLSVSLVRFLRKRVSTSLFESSTLLVFVCHSVTFHRFRPAPDRTITREAVLDFLAAGLYNHCLCL